VGSFDATNTSSGDIALTNTSVPFTINAVSNTATANNTLANNRSSSIGGNVLIDNTGAIVVAGAMNASGSLIMTAHSPLTVNAGASIVAGGNVVLTAGSPGSTAAADLININGTITGKQVTLAANRVGGNIPAGAILDIMSTTTAPAPTVLDTLNSVVALLPPPPLLNNIIETPVVTTADVGQDPVASTTDIAQGPNSEEKTEESANLAVTKTTTKTTEAVAAKPLPVCGR
jgi:hypothetical protein